MVEVKPIRTEADCDEALKLVESLWRAKPATPEGDRLEVLLTLVEAYEAKHYPVAPPDPVDAILFRLEQEGLTRADLEDCIGPRGRVSEVLSRRRPLSIGMIRKLHARFKIPAEVLIAPSAKLTRRAAPRTQAAKKKVGKRRA